MSLWCNRGDCVKALCLEQGPHLFLGIISVSIELALK